MKSKYLLLLAALLLLLSGCGGTPLPLRPTETAEPQPAAEESTPAPAADAAPASMPLRETVPFVDAVFHAALAEDMGGCLLDLSAAEEGYVAVSAASDRRLKFQVIKDGVTYTYDLASDGTPSIFPLQSGDGSYSFRLMENVMEGKYSELCSSTREVTLADEFQPYLRPNVLVNYSETSACVGLARELAAASADDAGLIKAVYDYICVHVRYDTEKALTVKAGYLPDPDSTLREEKGICFDYAALGAAMLRSQGVPTKLITGYVSPDGLYHAWNMFYTEASGWITVEFRIDPRNWNRLDLTFSAGGTGAEFVGDGSNYAALYQY